MKRSDIEKVLAKKEARSKAALKRHDSRKNKRDGPAASTGNVAKSSRNTFESQPRNNIAASSTTASSAMSFTGTAAVSSSGTVVVAKSGHTRRTLLNSTGNASSFQTNAVAKSTETVVKSTTTFAGFGTHNHYEG